MSSPYYIPEDKIPLPPKGADVLSTCCDYCIVACGYKIYRWPTGSEGGPKAKDNAFEVDFPTSTMETWVAPTQHNVVMHNNRPHNVIVIPDKDATVVNTNGDSSMRGGLLAQKCYNPQSETRDRLQTPLLRVWDTLMPVSWEFALEIAAEVAKHVILKHGANAYSVKSFSYGYIENTYAITKYASRMINTAAFTWHDTPADVTSTPGFRDAGFDNFGPSYDDWKNAETLIMLGTDPYETKSILFTQHIMEGIRNGQKAIMVNPRSTAGTAFVLENGGLHLDLYPGTDTPLLGAICRIIVENGWEDADWIKNWVNSKWESSSGFGQGTRNTPWQWRTTWGKFQTKGFEDWKKWLMAQEIFDLDKASEITGVDKAKIRKAAEWMAKPKANGTRPKTSLGIEKGFYWSNNTANTNAVSALAIICGAGGRPGQVVGRFGGHQRGGRRASGYPRNLSPEKVPGRRRRSLDTDRWLVSGHTRLAHVIGTTWIQAMCGSQGLQTAFHKLVTANPHQVRSFDKQEIINTLKKRADSGGTVVFNQDIYLVDPIGSTFADIVFPASGWGENDFMRANGERRLRLYRKFYDAPGEAKPDWWIIAQLSKRMGFKGFDWKNSNEVAEESSRFSRGGRKAYHMVKVAAHKEGKTLHQKLGDMGTTGIQGPTFYNYQTGKLSGTKRLHDTTRTEADLGSQGAEKANMMNKKITHFNSQTGKCNLQKFPWSLYADFWEFQKPKNDELWMTNGRINELWQSGYDDKRRAYVNQRWPENFVEIHPDDAKARGIESGDYVMLYSDRVPGHMETILGIHGDDFQFSTLMKNGFIKLTKAAVTGVAMVTPAIKKGVMYTSFLDTRQPSNALMPRVVDQISGNYNYKLGVARIKKIGDSPYKKEFRTMSFAPRNIPNQES